MRLFALRLALAFVEAIAVRAVSTAARWHRALRIVEEAKRANVPRTYGQPRFIVIDGLPLIRHGNGRTSEARGVQPRPQMWTMGGEA